MELFIKKFSPRENGKIHSFIIYSRNTIVAFLFVHHWTPWSNAVKPSAHFSRGSAPASNRITTSSTWSCKTAIKSGVWPEPFLAFTSAARGPRSKSFTIEIWFRSTAACKGVVPATSGFNKSTLSQFLSVETISSSPAIEATRSGHWCFHESLKLGPVLDHVSKYFTTERCPRSTAIENAPRPWSPLELLECAWPWPWPFIAPFPLAVPFPFVMAVPLTPFGSSLSPKYVTRYSTISNWPEIAA